MPARVCSSGVTSTATLIAPPRHAARCARAVLEPREAARVREAARDEVVALGERALDRPRDRRRVVGIDAHGGVAARLVERRMRRRRRTARRTPSPRARGSRSPRSATGTRTRPHRGRAAELLARRVAEPHDPRRRRAPAGRPSRRRRRRAASIVRAPSRCAATSGARFFRGSSVADGEHVLAVEVAPLAFGRERRVDAGVRDVDTRRVDAERGGDVVAGEARVDDDHVAAAAVCRYFAPCMRRVRAVHPVREVERHEVVDHRRADVRRAAADTSSR